MRAVWNGITIAESDDTLVVEGNHYFPADSVDPAALRSSRMKSVCPWKGLASYYHVEAGGERSPNAAWTYRHPYPWIRKVKNRIAFWNGWRSSRTRYRTAAAERPTPSAVAATGALFARSERIHAPQLKRPIAATPAILRANAIVRIRRRPAKPERSFVAIGIAPAHAEPAIPSVAWRSSRHPPTIRKLDQ